MRDQLIGYALGALDAPEHEEVESQLGKDPWLREQLDLLRKALAPLECDRQHIEPPPGLATTTCRRVLAAERPSVPLNTTPVMLGSAEQERAHAPVTRGWSLVDLAVAAGIVLAAGALFLPAINHSRFNAQVTNCQNNLALIGHSLHDYSQKDPQNRYPVIPASGKLSAAGLYAPQLVENGVDPKIFRCGLSSSQAGSDAKIPRLKELRDADEDKLQDLLTRAGGSYGYTLGYDQDGVYHPTQSLGRSNFPIMADAPCRKLKFQQSSNHGGYGQNVLFDDGHVRYLTTCREPEGCPDPNFFRNAKGQIAAGTNVDDAVIGCSQARPHAETSSAALKAVDGRAIAPAAAPAAP